MTPFTAVILFLKIFFTCTIFFKTSKAQYTLPEFRATEAPEMPKGVFSYQKAETSIKNEMHVPNADFSKPMEIATELINTAVAKASHRNEGFSGVKIPLPFGLSPLNLQLSRNSETQMGVSHENNEEEKSLTTTVSPSPSSSNHRRAPDLNSRTRSALESARRICIKQSQRLCDAALDKYHQLKFGRSVAEDRKQLRKAQPQDWATYVQTGIAKWFVPGLDNQLNKIILNQTTAIQSPTTTISPSTTPTSTESTITEISISNSKTIRFKPKRIKTILPARRKIFLPPRS